MMKRVVLIAGMVICGSMTTAWGQVNTATPQGENLTITVTGEAKGKPDTMYVTLAAEATAGNAADAFQQCKQKADSAATAIEDLKIPNSEVIREMYVFSSPSSGNPYNIAQPSASPSGTKVSQALKIKVPFGEGTEMDKLAGIISRVLDAANKTGVGFTPMSPWQAQVSGQATVTPVTYALEDATALRKKAVADSQSKAEEIKENLAASGVKAGKLVGVTYAQTPMLQWPMVWPTVGAGAQIPDGKSAISSSPEEVTVYCHMSSMYEVARIKE